MLSQKQILDLLFEGEIKKETDYTNTIITTIKKDGEKNGK